MSNVVEELQPSELGTKEYWDGCYETELTNFSDHGDVGEVWFGEDAGIRMIGWLADNPDLVPVSSSIIDIGTGNGMLCVDIVREGFSNVTGVDYSERAIELAKQVSKECDVPVTYEVGSILELNCPALNNTKYKVATDKGTFDAISLSESAKPDKKRYIENTASILEEDGLLLITSCNWTKEELLVQFDEHFSLEATIPTPVFQFGGKVGNVVTSLVLRKKKK